MSCYVVVQDPDRSCTPVDCAIKYEGLRNYFRNSTKKCEDVVDCDTQGPDGITIVAVSLLLQVLYRLNFSQPWYMFVAVL